MRLPKDPDRAAQHITSQFVVRSWDTIFNLIHMGLIMANTLMLLILSNQLAPLSQVYPSQVLERVEKLDEHVLQTFDEIKGAENE